MDIGLYRKYLQKYLKEAIEKSDGTKSGIAEYLSMIKVGGRFTRDKQEKETALRDVRNAFDEHRHWPLEIIISHLGVDKDSLD